MTSHLKKVNTVNEYLKNKDMSDETIRPYTPTPEDYAAIYARKSGSKDSFSIASQIADCKKYIEENNLFLYDTYQDKKSGRIFRFHERKGFKRLLNDLEAGMFKTVVLIRRDRLSRRIEDFMQIRKIFRRYGVKVIYTNEGEFISNQSNYLTNFLENIIMTISTYEPENIVRNTTAGRQFLRDRGIYNCGRRAPYGYKKCSKDNDKNKDKKLSNVEDTHNDKHQFEINNVQAKATREIFALFENLSSYMKKAINPLKLLVKQVNSIQKDARVFSKKTLVDLIKRPLYGGKILKKEGSKLEDFVELDKRSNNYIINEDGFIDCKNITKIIEWETWKKAYLNLYEIENGVPEPQYLFKKLIYCNNCNSILTLGNDTYLCSNGCITMSESILIHKIFRQILIDCEDDTIYTIFKSKFNNINKEISNLKRLLSSKEVQLRDKISSYINTDYKSIENEITDLNKEIKKIKTQINTGGEIKSTLSNVLNNLQAYTLQLTDFSEIDICYFKENNTTYHNMISKFVSKVVLQKQGHDYTIRIQYK